MQKCICELFGKNFMQSHYVHIYRQVCKSFKSSLLGRHQKSEDLFLEEHDPQADPNAMQVIQLEQRC